MTVDWIVGYQEAATMCFVAPSPGRDYGTRQTPPARFEAHRPNTNWLMPLSFSFFNFTSKAVTPRHPLRFSIITTRNG